MKRQVTYTFTISVVALAMGLFSVTRCAVGAPQAQAERADEEKAPSQDAADSTLPPIPTQSPCSECEFARQVRDVELVLEQARHDQMMAEIKLAIEANRRNAESYRDLSYKIQKDLAPDFKRWDDNSILTFWRWIPDGDQYAWKVLGNTIALSAEYVVFKKGAVSKMPMGAVACKVSNGAAQVISKIGQPTQVVPWAKRSFKNWKKTLCEKGTWEIVKKQSGLQGNVDDPNLFECAIPYVPIVGPAYQAGFYAVAQPLEETLKVMDKAERLAYLAGRMREVSDEFWALDEAKREAEKIHADNIARINEESKLWEIPGCCSHHQALLDDEACRGRPPGQPAPEFKLVTE